MPKISIGMPVFNGQKYLANAIESILVQTFTDFELIISDNCSTDDTAQICSYYLKKDPRIVYHRNETNLGAAKNYNLLPFYAKGKYFKWAAYDDLLGPTYLEKCTHALEKDDDVVIAYSRTTFIDQFEHALDKEDDKIHLQLPSPHSRFKSLIRNYSLCMPITGLMRLEVLRQTRMIGPYIGSDYILMVEMSLLGKFIQIPEYLFYRRDHETNVRRLSLADRARWFDPNYKGILYRLPSLLLWTEQVKTILRVNISAMEKLICCLLLVIWAFKKLRDSIGRMKRAIQKRLSKIAHTYST